MSRLARPFPLFLLLAGSFVILALLRGIDHDESQYVAAARLTADGLLPYRDYAYLQTPLQPFAFAPITWLTGDWAWPALRIANALLGALAVAATWRGMCAAGAAERPALAAAALFAACDILLFSSGTARNDALPCALFALALAPMLRAERGEGTPATAALIGLLLASAAAAKVSYALPAAAYGVYALLSARHRAAFVPLGAVPPIVLVAWLAWLAPEAFVFGTLTFPAEAPAEYYAASDRLWKLSLWAKGLDTAKFLALGPALFALIVVAGGWRKPGDVDTPGRRLLIILFAAGVVAALLPAPTWRQYLLPALPPLFVLLSRRWMHEPASRPWRVAAIVFAIVGLAPSGIAIVTGKGLGVGMAVTRALESLPEGATVATLSPQMLPAHVRPDPRFATGPFYFRSTSLLDAPAERRLHLVSRARIDAGLAGAPPDLVLVGGEGKWTSGDDRLDAALEEWAVQTGWTPLTVPAGFRLYARPQAAMATRLRASSIP